MESFVNKIFDGYINMNTDEIRENLKEIETEIKTIVGPGKEDWVEIPKKADREKIWYLLKSRSYCLNMLFRKDPNGIEKFREINNLLKDLSDRLYKKGAKVYRQYLSSGVDNEFDDDFMIEADLRFVYNGNESVSVLGDEEYYGSDFNYMMNVISDLNYHAPLAGASYSKCFLKTDTPEMSDEGLQLDNTYDKYYYWSEIKDWIPEVIDIKICNAINEMLIYNKYSVADLLRMNDFRCEVKAVYQHFRDQDANRWT